MRDKNFEGLKGIFFLEEMSRCLVVGLVSPPSPSPGFSSKVPQKKGQSTPGGGNKVTLKEGDIFGQNGDTAGIIQGHHPAAHCFLLTHSSVEFFQINHDSTTERMIGTICLKL